MNPTSLRRTLKVICMAVVCAVLPACAGHGEVVEGGNGPPREPPEPLNCKPLSIGNVAYSITSDQESSILEYPGHQGRIAVLEIPSGTVPQNSTWTFTLATPKQSVAQVNIVATDEKGDTITDFANHPLTLTLFVRKDCSPGKPGSGKSIYIYRTPLNANDPGLGDYEDHIFRTPRVTAKLDHLSGYILAQGFR